MPVPLRRKLGYVVVGSLCVAAVTAIAALLTGSFDDTHWRVVGTSLAFAVYSALAASGAAMRVKEHPAALPLGSATVAAAGTGFALLLLLLWVVDDGEGLARTWGVVSIVALGCSHASLVLRSVRTTDTPAISTLVAASIALGGFDAAAGALATAGAVEGGESEARLMAVTIVLLVLSTALPPILRRMQPEPTAPPAPTWPASRSGSLEALASAVVTVTERIERLDDPEAVRAECRSLRDLARTLGG